MEALSREAFHTIAPYGAIVPVYRELPADLETPVSVYLKLRGQGPSFLLESVEKAGQVGRYSILGLNPIRQIITRGRQVTILDGTLDNGAARVGELEPGQDPLHMVEEEMRLYQPVAPLHQVARGLPRFLGGAVGYMSYDLVRFFERLPEPERDDLNLPDMHLLFTDSLAIFDHLLHRLLVVVNVPVTPEQDLDKVYDAAVSRLDTLEAKLSEPLPRLPVPPGQSNGRLVSNMSRDKFEAAVRRAKAYIEAGDIFQVVLSQRLSRQTRADPFSIYRTLRRLNPSPYMFFLNLGGDPPLHIIGSSPEMLVRLQEKVAEVRPIAGTRPRGQTDAEDLELEADLLQDPKERAEHVMLVDLGRNDLGRVCEYGSVDVPELLSVEHYSHVIHLVSRVTGSLRDDVEAYDLLRATFPAGTVSGAPKVRAMEILGELEGVQRGPYAGAVGYFSFNGNMDTCIAIRTIILQGECAYLQAGAGIVADSDPTREWEETLHKAQALAVAIDMAEQGR